MLRILFIILAVVSTILAIVLEQPILYAAAGVLLLIALVILIVQVRHRRRVRARSARPATPQPRSKEEELSSLGILEIRPKEKTGGSRPKPAGRPEPAPVQAELKPREEHHEARAALPVLTAEEVEVAAPAVVQAAEMQTAPVQSAVVQVEDAPSPVETAPASPAGAVTVKRKEQAENGRPPVDRPKREVLTAALHALQVAIDATTVCLLKQEELALRYDIVAIVSKNHYARSQGHFTTKVPLLTPSTQQRAVSLMRVGEKGISARNLGYYIEPIAARQLAIAAVPHPSDLKSYFLLADTMEDGGLGTARQRKLLTEFAALVASLLDMREPQLPAEEEPEVRPRRDIIAEEMQKARSHERPLGLALVYFNRAEETAEEGEAAVLEAERLLEERLREVVGAARRVERFGELTYGVFCAEDVTGVESWAAQLQRDFAEEAGLLQGGVSIGIAMLQERHQNPDLFRADATEALREAYETGACTILA